MSTDQEMSGSVGALPSVLQPAVDLILQAIVTKHRLPAPLTAVEATITAMRPSVDLLFPEASGTEVYAQIARTVMEQVSVEIAPPLVLAPDFEPWFAHAVTSGSVKLERWYSYKQFLTHDKLFAPQVLEQLDQSSSEVVDLLGDPSQSGSWKRRGLVIGDVQSGKTATYIGIVPSSTLKCNTEVCRCAEAQLPGSTVWMSSSRREDGAALPCPDSTAM